MNKQLDNRIKWVDIAKGIGIISVVVGHLYEGILHLTMPIIYLYHIPLFFFISGFLYKKEDNLKYITKKTKNLLIPYLNICILITLIKASFNQGATLYSYIESILLGNPGESFDINIAPLWFLPSLFLSMIIYNLFHHIFSIKYISIVCVLLFIAMSIFNLYFTNKITVWHINILPVTLLLIHIGYTIRTSDIPSYYKTLSLIIGAIAILSPLILKNNTLDLHYNKLGIPIFTIMCSGLSILFLKNISEKIVNYHIFQRILGALGKASLTIMAFHICIFTILVDLLKISPFYNLKLMSLYLLMTLTVCYGLHILFSKNKITQIIFLGNYNNKN